MGANFSVTWPSVYLARNILGEDIPRREEIKRGSLFTRASGHDQLRREIGGDSGFSFARVNACLVTLAPHSDVGETGRRILQRFITGKIGGRRSIRLCHVEQFQRKVSLIIARAISQSPR